ncbi:Protein of unknown function [Cohaesibacter sp. ES.047]|uniref:DUF3164 family protein n=1 Tax=Cohaesibacter sp. ES.047 TaxID=1798205 RepID=UPI000BB94DB5|nr:DUF3164 family protein [Cohaesibacter sp. ES.047]SNY91371.1 Protein of unknown function [Cohaesibacter sp. ES.047]
MTDQIQIPEGFMLNAKGDLVHESNIRAQHLLEDELVNKLIERAKPLNEALSSFRENAISEIDGFVDLLVSSYGDKKRGGRKGNVTLTSFDGSKRIELVVAETIGFGPELIAARELIEECLREWTENANPQLMTIVERAFRLNKKGEITVSNVMELHQYEFTDERWRKAMRAINDSTRATSTKRYVRISERRNQDEKFSSIPLDAVNA